jgi:fatty acid-binding protein DegV
MDELLKLCETPGGVEEIAVAHTTTPEDAAALAERARTASPGVPLHLGRFGPVLGVHGGPGMLGLAVVDRPAG